MVAVYCSLYCISLFFVALAPYGPWGGNALFHLLISALYKLYLFVYLPFLHSSFLTLSFLLICFLTRLLPDLYISFFQNRPVKFPGWKS